MQWYRLAANQGVVQAPYKLGVAYYTGEGVERNFIYAHMWFSVAVSQGAALANDAQADAEAEMTPWQIEVAQALAKVCLQTEFRFCGD